MKTHTPSNTLLTSPHSSTGIQIFLSSYAADPTRTAVGYFLVAGPCYESIGVPGRYAHRCFRWTLREVRVVVCEDAIRISLPKPNVQCP